MQVNLVLFKKSGESKSFSLPSTATVIGRRPDCDLCIPLPVVSRRHCQLYIEQDNLKIRDLGSKNGTLLNGEKIEDEAQVNPGDTLQIGTVAFVTQINGEPVKVEPPQTPPSDETSETPSADTAKEHAEEFADVDHGAATAHHDRETDDPLNVDKGLDALDDELGLDDDADEDILDDEDFDAELRKELSEN